VVLVPSSRSRVTSGAASPTPTESVPSGTSDDPSMPSRASVTLTASLLGRVPSQTTTPAAHRAIAVIRKSPSGPIDSRVRR